VFGAPKDARYHLCGGSLLESIAVCVQWFNRCQELVQEFIFESFGCMQPAQYELQWVASRTYQEFS
jgi:hypothetical protein